MIRSFAGSAGLERESHVLSVDMAAHAIDRPESNAEPSPVGFDVEIPDYVLDTEVRQLEIRDSFEPDRDDRMEVQDVVALRIDLARHSPDVDRNGRPAPAPEVDLEYFGIGERRPFPEPPNDFFSSGNVGSGPLRHGFRGLIV
jgi:hypothetical protein